MSDNIRVYVPGYVYELVIPVLNHQRLLKPTPDVQRPLRGLLAQLSTMRGIQLHAYAVLSSHLHLLVTTQATQAIPVAMQDFKSAAAKRVNRALGRRGPLWNGPYGATMVTHEPRKQLERLRYVLRHGEKEGLVADVTTSPFLNAAKVILGTDPKEGLDMKLVPMPVLALVPRQVQLEVVRLLLRSDLKDGEALDLALERLAAASKSEVRPESQNAETAGEPQGAPGSPASVTNVTSLGDQMPEEYREVFANPPRRARPDAPGRRSDVPTSRRRKPPKVHASSLDLRTRWLALFNAIAEMYADISPHFMAGEMTEPFPTWTLRPPLWRVRWWEAILCTTPPMLAQPG